jgi:hypothetical protein
MIIKYFDEFEGQWTDVTGTIGSSLVITDNGFEALQFNKKYVVALTQSGTDDPIVTTEYINTIGTIIWTRSSDGQYNGNLTDAFIGNMPKIEGTIGMVDTNVIRYFSLYKIGDSDVGLRTWLSDGSTQSDDILKETTIEISIY